jgi:hypothetical protein
MSSLWDGSWHCASTNAKLNVERLLLVGLRHILVAVAEKWKSCLQYDVEFAGRVGGPGPRALVQRDAPKKCATKLYCRLSSVQNLKVDHTFLTPRYFHETQILISELETDNLIKSTLGANGKLLGRSSRERQGPGYPGKHAAWRSPI